MPCCEHPEGEHACPNHARAVEACRVAYAFLYGPGMSAECSNDEWGRVRNILRAVIEPEFDHSSDQRGSE